MPTNPCPFCGGRDVRTRGYSRAGHFPEWRSCCQDCESVGPYAGSSYEAKVLWNQRHRPDGEPPAPLDESTATRLLEVEHLATVMLTEKGQLRGDNATQRLYLVLGLIPPVLADYLEAVESGQPEWAAEIREQAHLDPRLSARLGELEASMRDHPDA